jgi:hypothetical protein
MAHLPPLLALSLALSSSEILSAKESDTANVVGLCRPSLMLQRRLFVGNISTISKSIVSRFKSSFQILLSVSFQRA